MKLISNFFKSYLEDKRKFDASFTFKNTLKAHGISFGLVLLVLIPIMLILYTFYAYVHIQLFLSYLVLVLLIASIFLYLILLYKIYQTWDPSLKNVSLKKLILFDGILIGILILIIGSIIISSIFARL